MDEKIILFKELAVLFNEHHFNLHLVGGSVRDYLLGLPLTDMDLVTDATPADMESFLPEANYTFKKYGSVKLHYKKVKFDITTLRKESDYVDSRHPNAIIFTNKLEEDVLRRDLTINALYLSKELKVIDLVDGQVDLNHHLLRMIGDPLIRIEEDPLRIIRTFRFKLDLNFEIEPALKKAIEGNYGLVNKLRIEKIKEEIKKCHHQDELTEIVRKFGINNL